MGLLKSLTDKIAELERRIEALERVAHTKTRAEAIADHNRIVLARMHSREEDRR
ncbi:MAG: hypothetical protein KJN62_00435 [Deltaproteobacteria bacterium]|nr:hypothetical protein [Deltaproteobacteria bacterium]